MQYQLPINLLIADDHQLITDGLSQILQAEKMIGEIHIANNGKEALELLSQSQYTGSVPVALEDYVERKYSVDAEPALA